MHKAENQPQLTPWPANAVLGPPSHSFPPSQIPDPWRTPKGPDSGMWVTSETVRTAAAASSPHATYHVGVGDVVTNSHSGLWVAWDLLPVAWGSENRTDAVII
jgi:hypothetical protein